MKELLSRHNLIYELVVKELKLRYSQPLLGFLWTFLSPFLMAAIFYLVFSVILKIKVEESPFFLYLMSAIFPWGFFQSSVVSSTTSLVDNRNIIKEAGFPHYFIPVSVVLANFVTFLPSLGILITISAILLKGLPLFIIFLPLTLIIHLAITTGLSVMLSILYIKWRDLRYIVEIALLLLFYMTPVFYPVSFVKNSFPNILFKAYIYNPFVGVLNLYRIQTLKGFDASLLNNIPALSFTLAPFIFSVLFLFVGFYYYKANKDRINDYLSY